MFFSLIGKRNILVGEGGIKSTVDHLLPARKRSFDMAMFSQVFVCPWGAGGGGALLPSMHHRSHAQHRRGGGCLPTGGGGLPMGEGGWADPPELEKRAVRILLECFLVSDICLHMGTEVGRGVVPDQ